MSKLSHGLNTIVITPWVGCQKAVRIPWFAHGILLGIHTDWWTIFTYGAYGSTEWHYPTTSHLPSPQHQVSLMLGNSNIKRMMIPPHPHSPPQITHVNLWCLLVSIIPTPPSHHPSQVNLCCSWIEFFIFPYYPFSLNFVWEISDIFWSVLYWLSTLKVSLLFASFVMFQFWCD